MVSGVNDPGAPKIRRGAMPDLPRIAELFDAYRQFYGQAPDPELSVTPPAVSFGGTDLSACRSSWHSMSSSSDSLLSSSPTFTSLRSGKLRCMTDKALLTA